MTAVTITKLCEHPEFSEKAALWFHEKWGIPLEAYRESIRQCTGRKTGIPQWYLVLDEDLNIIAGAGMIDNDFHDRKDLSPNLCALFVEKEHRKRGIAKHILDFARKDAGRIGFEKLYLITDHTDFYERCGWEFLTMVREENGAFARMYAASTLS